ncbi:MAG: WG repeat-containing protein [Bacteroidia bacterium]|nr:WG repeat-containing protein [Bacteroidia bacterium]MDW8347718.1 WG repeat-containing protein [Bacteroidia bacterium]
MVLCSLSIFAQQPKKFVANNKVGYKSADGRVIIPAMYDNGDEYIISGYTRVLKNGKMGMIDSTNKIILPIEYDGVRLSCSNTVSVQKDGKWGVVELGTNKVIIPFQYEYIGEGFIEKIRGTDTTFTYGINDGGWIPAKENGKWGFISMKNNKETNFIFDDVDFCCNSFEIGIGDKVFAFRGRAKHIPAVFMEGQWVEIVYDEKEKKLSTVPAKLVAKRGDLNFNPKK